MLEALGIASVDELFRDIPKKARIGRIGIAPGREEPEVVEEIDKLLDRNRPPGEFATSSAGGSLAATFPRPSMRSSPAVSSTRPIRRTSPRRARGCCRRSSSSRASGSSSPASTLANASLYDGATAAGEALLLCRRLHDGTRFLVPASLPWEEKSVLANYGAGHRAPDRGDTVRPHDRSPRPGVRPIGDRALGGVFGMLADVPNGFGHLDEGVLDLKSILGSTCRWSSSADPLSLSVLEPPGAVRRRHRRRRGPGVRRLPVLRGSAARAVRVPQGARSG